MLDAMVASNQIDAAISTLPVAFYELAGAIIAAVAAFRR
jgi:hypothetical protein